MSGPPYVYVRIRALIENLRGPRGGDLFGSLKRWFGRASWSAGSLPVCLSFEGLGGGGVSSSAGRRVRLTCEALERREVPTVTVTNPGSQTNYESDTPNLSIAASSSYNNSLEYTASGLPSGLSIGLYTATITGTFSGASLGSPYSISVTATDPLTSEYDTQTFSWSINYPVSYPVLSAQTNYVSDAVSLSFGCTDVAGTLTYSASGLPSGLSINSSTGQITGTVSNGANTASPYSVTVTASDGTYGVQENFSWTVADRSPQAQGDSYGIVVYTSGTAANCSSVLANDADADGDSLTAVLVSTANYGNLTLNSDGTFSYTPNTGYSSLDSFTYKANDGIANGNTVTVTLDIDNAPTATGDDLSVAHDQALGIDLLAHASDADSDPLSVAVVQTPAHGSLIYNEDTGLYDYAPEPGYTGGDSFVYKVNDGVADSNTATVTLTATNTAPMTCADAFVVEHDQVLPGIDLNQDVGDAEGDLLTISIVSGPAHGQLTHNRDGTYVYTPDANYIGTDSFTIQANDGVASSSTATISLTVTQYAPLNADDTYSVLHDRTLTDIDFSANDSEANGDPAAVLIVSGPSHGTLAQNVDGTYDYSPDDGYVADDSVVVAIDGGSPVTVTLHVRNDAPVVWDTSVSLEAYQGEYDGLAFLAQATDVDADALTFEIVSGPAHGTLTLNGSTGLYDYVADTSYLGRDGFSIRYFDGAEYSTTVSADILVYDDTTNFATDSYVQGFALLAGADTSFNGLPSPTNLRQGNIRDCWFIAAAAGLANATPNNFQNGQNGTPIITHNGAGATPGSENYTVTFSGWAPVTFDFTPGQPFADPTPPANDPNRQMSFSTNADNGDWTAILEKAWAFRNAPNAGTWADSIKQVLDVATPARVGIEAMTGSQVRFRSIRDFSFDDWLPGTLETVTGLHLVTAVETTPAPARDPNARFGSNGLVVGTHAYTVMSYNATTQMVQLRNPWGINGGYWYQREVGGGLGADWRWSGVGLGGANNNGTFSLSLSRFKELFEEVAFEQS